MYLAHRYGRKARHADKQDANATRHSISTSRPTNLEYQQTVHGEWKECVEKFAHEDACKQMHTIVKGCLLKNRVGAENDTISYCSSQPYLLGEGCSKPQ